MIITKKLINTSLILFNLKRKIAFIVCSNGYGHLKRVVAIISALLRRNESFEIDIFCKKTLIEFAHRENNFKLGTNILRYHHDATNNEINWLDEKQITISKYNKWFYELKTNSILNNADLILSDNHVLPLRIFKNSRLIGSFLWYNLNLPLGKEAQKIVNEECDFIRKRKPDMICSEVMAMPEVINYTNPIKLPWYCNRLPKSNMQNSRKAILVTGGGTSLITNFFTNYTKLISILMSEWDIFVDLKLHSEIGKARSKNVKLFKFNDEEFLSLNAIICRPGLGILNDCVKYCIPSIVFEDISNSEINHNAKRVKELGIGISFSQDTPIDIILYETVALINDDFRINKIRSNLENQVTGGADLCADYIVNLIK